MKKSTIVTCLLVLLFIAGYNIASAQRIIVTYAGTGISGFSGDQGSGKSAQINYPHDVCMDAAHNIYFVDEINNRIRMVSAAKGVITTIAGGGTSTADGVPAIIASLTPNYLCIDAAGNLYVTTSNKIRKINATTGIITTVAGSGTAGFTGDGGLAIAASLNGPEGICIDAAGNIYFADGANNRIRKITAATGIISTIGGTGVSSYSGDGGPALSATMSGPDAIGVDASGNVFFSDQYGNYIREIVAATGMMLHIAGIPGGVVAAAAGGPAATTAIGQIYGIHVDPVGDIYCDDGSCSCVRIDMSSGNIYLEAGSLSVDGYNGDDRNAINEYLNVPGGLWVDGAGNIFIADANNNRMRKAIQLTHTPTFAFGAAQYAKTCSSAPVAIDSQLTITDIDLAQTETWTVISAPLHGTLTGFPFTATSLGTVSVVTPVGVSYVPIASYSGLDSFRVKVSDGALSDIVTVYIDAQGAGTITGPNHVCGPATITLAVDIPGGTWSATNANAIVSADGAVTGVSVGIDSIQYSIVNACGLVTSTIVVTVDPSPSSFLGTIAASGTTVCVGATITLTDVAAAGGEWTSENTHSVVTSGGVVTGVTAGTDIIFYWITNSCGLEAAEQAITINPAPDAGTITASEPTLCLGSTMTLIDGAAGGVWSVKNSNLTITGTGLVSGITIGTDTVLYTATNSCGTAVASQEIDVHDCSITGVNSVSSTPAVTIFPNPVSTTLNVEWTALQPGNATIVVTDVTSREVLRTALFDNNNGAGTTQLNISDLKEGMYILTLNAESAHFTSKFVVSK